MKERISVYVFVLENVFGKIKFVRMWTTEQGTVKKENYNRNVQSSFPFLISYIDCDKSCVPTSYWKYVYKIIHKSC